METKELSLGTYSVPEGCTAKMVGRTIQVYESKRHSLAQDEVRCKDCQHFTMGHTSLSRYNTSICDAKPKKLSEELERRRRTNPIYRDYKVFYSAQKYDKPCDKFVQREERG